MHRRKPPQDTRATSRAKPTQITQKGGNEQEYILVHVRLRKETYKRYLDEGYDMRPMKKVHTIATEILENAVTQKRS
jgi:hypothetical protein